MSLAKLESIGISVLILSITLLLILLGASFIMAV